MPNPTNGWADYQSQLNGPGNTIRDIAQGFLAPGISWLADATGNQTQINNLTDFAGIWKNTVENKNMTQDVYNSMTPAEWDAFQKMNPNDQDGFIASRKTQIGQQNPIKSAQDKMISQLTAFAQQMNMPVDQLLKQDDFAKMLHGTSIAQGVQQGIGQGLGAGGYSQNAANASATKSLLGYQMQRQQAGNQALDQINNIYSQQQGMQLTNNAINTQAANAYLQNVAAGQQKMESGLLAAFGGGAGAAGLGASALKNQQSQPSGGAQGYGSSMPNSNYGTSYSGGGPSYGTYGGGSGAGSGVGYNSPSPIPTNNGGNY